MLFDADWLADWQAEWDQIYDKLCVMHGGDPAVERERDRVRHGRYKAIQARDEERAKSADHSRKQTANYWQSDEYKEHLAFMRECGRELDEKAEKHGGLEAYYRSDEGKAELEESNRRCLEYGMKLYEYKPGEKELLDRRSELMLEHMRRVSAAAKA